MANTKIPIELSSTPSISDSGDATAITITSDEKVGVGTTTPSQILNVEATSTPVIEVSTLDDNNPASASAIDLVEKQPTHASNTATFGQSGVYGYRIQLNGSDNTLRIKSGSQTTTNERITLARDTGNVGIGNSGPRQKLSVTGPIVSTGALATLGAAGSYNDGAFNATALDYYNDGARSWSWGSSSARGTFNWYQLENDGQNQINSMTLHQDGEFSIPYQPCLTAIKGSDTVNVGHGTTQTLSFTNEYFDIGSNFDGTYFTAPEDGMYLVAVSIRLQSVESNLPYAQVYLTASNNAYYIDLKSFDDIANQAVTFFRMNGSVVVHLDAGDTCYVRFYADNLPSGSNTMDIDSVSQLSIIKVS